jgi:hypothetical protein
MAQAARVESVEALKHFRAALVKFATEVRSATGEAQSTVSRARSWVDDQQKKHWDQQIRRRTQALIEAKEALRAKRLYKRPDGSFAPADEEEKAVKRAERRLDEAEAKLQNVKRWSTALEREAQIFRGQIQGLASNAENDVPRAMADLDRLIITLETYLAEAAVSASRQLAGSAKDAATMTSGRPSTQDDDTTSGQHYGAQRLGSPSREERQEIDASALNQEFSSLTIDKADLAQFAELDLPTDAPGPKTKLLLTPQALAATHLYLHRIKTDQSDDSGWFIGCFEPDENQPEIRTSQTEKPLAVALKQLIELRPQLAPFLDLPPGYLLEIEAGRIVMIVDDLDQPLWTDESI